MSYLSLAYAHLATIVPAFLIGTYQLISRKGTPRHKFIGKIYMALMLLTAVITLFMPAHVGPTVFWHFGFIHAFSALVAILVPVAYISARKGNIRAHRSSMIGVYVGGILIAGTFALMPGRMLHQWLFGGH